MLSLALAGVLLIAAGSAPADHTAPPLLDNFNRANENPLSQAGAWANLGGGSGLELVSNQVRSASFTRRSYRTAPGFPGDVTVYATIAVKSPGHNDRTELLVNLQQEATSGWDGYVAWVNTHGTGTDQFQLLEVTNGQTTLLKSVAREAGTGERIALRRRGPLLELWSSFSGITWQKVFQVADTTYTGGKVGIGISSNHYADTRLDDFGAGTGAWPPQAPIPPAPKILDNFDRANETPVSQGGNWAATGISGGAGANLANQRLQGNGFSYRLTQYTGDMAASALVTGGPSSQAWLNVYVALQDVGTAGFDGYELRATNVNGPDSWQLRRVDNGVVTVLRQLSMDIVVGGTMYLRRAGERVEFWYRPAGGVWQPKLAARDSTYTQGKIGAGVSLTGSLDDFGGGAVVFPNGPPHSQSTGTCSGKGMNATAGSRCLSDPVNTLTGAFTTSVEDLALPGEGVPFAWSRSYTSSDATVGRLGPGWTDSYAVSLAIEGDGDVELHGDEGQRVFYAKQPDGSFVGAPGALSTLTEVAGGYELVRTDQVKYAFDAQGRLSSVKDRNDQGITFGYDGQGRLSTVTDAAGKQATVSYNASDLVSGVATQDGRSVGYGYTAGRLTTFTDVRGKVWTYTYDTGGRLATVVDPLAHTQVTNVYRTDGRVESQTDALGETTTLTWDEAEQLATVTDANGKVWEDDYQANLLFQQVDAQGDVTQFFYDEDFNQNAVSGPSAEQTTLEYDGAGNLLKATAPESLGSAQKTFQYNGRNDPTQVTDARGKVTAYTYTPAGNTQTVTQDGTQVGSYTYTPAGQVETFTDGNSKTTTYTYEPDGDLASVTDHLGNKTTYTYDGAGRMLTRVDPKGNVQGADPADFTWTYTYNAAGQVLTETDPLGKVTTRTYDDAGNELTVTDANNKTTTYAYDNANRLLSVTAPDGGVSEYTYDDVGNKLTETDPRDNTSTYTYDDANRLGSVTTASGAKTTYFYDGDGNLIREVGPRGNAQGANPEDFDTLYTYDAAGRLLSETDPLGNVTIHTYDAVGNELTLTDPRGKVTTNAYDGKNRLTSTTAPDGGISAYTYDPVGNKLTETDPRNKTTTSTYDAVNRLASVITPTGGKTTYTYDANGNQLSLVEPRGNVQGANPDEYRTTYTYDRANRRLTESDPLGNVTTTTYDDVGNELSVEDANDHTTAYTYDPVNRLKTVTAPDLGVTTYGYDLAGNLSARTDAENHTTNYAYDVDNRRTTVTSPIGQVWTTAYDPDGNVAALVDANGNDTPAPNDGKTTHSYDRAGRLTEIDYSDPTPDVRFGYDAAGNRTEMFDEASLGAAPGAPVVDAFERADEDPLSQAGAWSATGTSGPARLKVVANQGASTSTSSTGRSHRVGTFKNLEAQVTVAVKPGHGFPVGVNLGLQEVGGASWDGYRVIWVEMNGASNDSLRIERVQNNAVVATLASTLLEYAPGHKLGVRRRGSTIEVWVEQGAGWTKPIEGNDSTYADGFVGLEIHGLTGRLDDFALRSIGETYTYDNANRITAVTRGSDTFAYQYDLAGNVIRRTYPDSTQIDFTYDDDSRLASVTSSGQQTSYGYDAAGNLKDTTLPAGNGYTENRVYDRAGRLTEVDNTKAGTPLSRFVSTLDPVGNPLQIVRTGSLTETQTYTYDANDRFTGVCFQAGTCQGGQDPFIRWTYDKVGNRDTEARPSGTTTYTYNNADQLLTAGATTFTYDDNGNQTTKGSETFAYDLANRLKTHTAGATTTTYTYDGDGQRLRASTGSQPAEITNFLWDTNHELPQIALERDGTDALLRRYLYGARRLSMTTPSGTSYYHHDGLGSTVNLTSATGAAQWTYGYDPYGTTRTEIEEPGGQPDNFQKFTGGYLDPTGLYHLRARQYDSAAGRFLGPDPVEPDVRSAYVASYVYAGDRPTVMVDPSGETFVPSHRGHLAMQLASSPVVLMASSSFVPLCLPTQLLQVTPLCGGGLPRQPAAPVPPRPGGSGSSGKAPAPRAANLPNSIRRALERFEGRYKVVRIDDLGSAPRRTQQDIDYSKKYPSPPPRNTKLRNVCRTPGQRLEIAELLSKVSGSLSDLRVDQHQVNARRKRVGRNRPDVQGTHTSGSRRTRYYFEFDTAASCRGPAHAERTLANDPRGVVILINPSPGA